MGNLRSYIRSEDGNIAILFTFVFGLLLMFSAGAIDFSRVNAVRADLVESLDAAGLAIAQLDAANGPELRNLSEEEREEYLKEYGEDFFYENFSHEELIENLEVDFDINNLTITPEASGMMRTLILRAAAAAFGAQSVNGLTTIQMTADTEITRAANGDTEVALVLDITGSMSEDMDELRAAATEFVNVLVRADQSEYYSKVAVVPYSMSVNVGAANAILARGTTTPAKAITGVTRANPGVVTSNAHGFNNGDWVYISGVNGMTQINGRFYEVRNRTTNTFQLRRSGSSSNLDTRSSAGFSAYTSGGSIDCTVNRCPRRSFVARDNSRKFWDGSTEGLTNCVSERNGVDAYTDTAPTAARLGFVYHGAENRCPTNEVVPLTNVKETALDAISELVSGGSTGGHMGLMWGWYAVSPNFSALFTGDSRPADYSDEVSKSVVLMTDGVFNEAFCEGVVSRDSTNSTGGNAEKIGLRSPPGTGNCNSPNGTSAAQAAELCTAMKAAGVTIYTVGYRIAADTATQEMLENCSSGPAFYYLANDGDALMRQFAAIAQAVSQLHVSR